MPCVKAQCKSQALVVLGKEVILGAIPGHVYNHMLCLDQVNGKRKWEENGRGRGRSESDSTERRMKAESGAKYEGVLAAYRSVWITKACALNASCVGVPTAIPRRFPQWKCGPYHVGRL